MKKFFNDFINDNFNWFLFGCAFGSIVITFSYYFRGYLIW